MPSGLLQVFVELGNQQDDNSIIILPDDKGNATMLMDRVEYSNKMANLIGNGGYCKVKKDPTMRMEKKLSQILGKNKDLIPQTKYRQLIQHYSKLPHIYSLPKVHNSTGTHCQQLRFSMSPIELLSCGDHQPTNR